MTEYHLKLELPKKIPAAKAKTTFYWAPKGSFDSTYDANLTGLGPVMHPNIEFVRVAAAVFAADRSTLRLRGGSNWNQRNISVEVPVFDTARWSVVSDDLAELLNFLSGDSWKLRFVESPTPIEQERLIDFDSGAKRVVLLSGGADSAAGAIASRAELGQNKHILVSHVGSKNIAPAQKAVAQAIETAISGSEQEHIQVGFRRHKAQPNGTKFVDEPSTRSRSLLFLALGLAVASREKLPLWIPENGFASLNLPLGPERRGSLSTRTTYPDYLRRLSDILQRVGAHADITNPFEDLTKGEMFVEVANLIGKDEASRILSITHSCSNTGQRNFRIPVKTQCGVCFSCVVRRASFKAAGLKDATVYIDPKQDGRLPAWLAKKSIERAVQDLLNRGVPKHEIAAMHLPEDYPASKAFNLIERGFNELKEYYA
jgi:7-cyano-7-deazaguanine synthase in queuosine biosynthesis